VGLTVKAIAKLTRVGRYRDERGLYLQVKSPTNRSWLLRYEKAGRERWMGLGPLHAFGLNEARDRALKARQLLADGIDPLANRNAERRRQEAASKLQNARSITFEEAAQRYFERNNAKWKNAKHSAQFLSTLRQYSFRVMGKVPVAEIDTSLVLKVLQNIWGEKTETANRVRGRIEAVLNFAKVAGWRTGENPARWRGHLDQVLPARSLVQKVIHHRALPYADIAEFMRQLRGREGTAARALEFTILTAARTGETIGARWDEIDLQDGVWIVPAERMKAKREHRVPLSREALRLLEELPREKHNGYIFVGPRTHGLSNMAMDNVLQRMNFKDRATTHGFRSTFRDWAAEMTSFAPEIAEAALAHITGDSVERAYRRGDMLSRRRKLMDAWAEYCRRPTASMDVVVAIKRTSAVEENIRPSHGATSLGLSQPTRSRAF